MANHQQRGAARRLGFLQGLDGLGSDVSVDGFHGWYVCVFCNEKRFTQTSLRRHAAKLHDWRHPIRAEKATGEIWPLFYA